MNTDRYLTCDSLFDDCSVPQAAAHFQRAINEISSATTSNIPYIRVLIRKLCDENKTKEAKVIAKDFEEILNRIQTLFKTASLLSEELQGKIIS
jgi:hypothetical protein